jgi:hypothetical protein
MKTNPYTATMITLGLIGVGLGLVLAFGAATIADDWYPDEDAIAALLAWSDLLIPTGAVLAVGGLVVAGVGWQLAHIPERETVAERGSGNTEPESDLGVAGKAIEDGEWPRSN